MVLLAAMLGFPTAIAEQNAVAGRTNRLLGRWVDRVLVAFAQGADMFPSHMVLLTGNPVRPELVVAAGQAGAQPWSGRGGEAFHLLVFGGSQGARGINRVMAEALPALRGLPVPVEVLHQAAPADLPALEEAYGAAGIAHRLVPFIEDMGRAYAWAHLVLCRAGAVSLAEIALFRKPSVLIPFPHAVDDHQGRNAAVFRAAGASEVLGEAGLNGEALARLLGALAADPARLARMGEAAGGLARPGAGAAVVAECLRLARGEVRSG
jgi:UDP-N-acetylglucosamine--N-acetylmuramyl-(pentapeptide) pyrophosphoryl-undecaprenol N-acetylglucosamine transferase